MLEGVRLKYGTEYGAFCTYEVSAEAAKHCGVEPGWYWEAHVPGFKPRGPFSTEQDAAKAANDWR